MTETLNVLTTVTNTWKKVRFRSPLVSPINRNKPKQPQTPRNNTVSTDTMPKSTQHNKPQPNNNVNNNNDTQTIDNGHTKQHVQHINIEPQSHIHNTSTPITHDIYTIALCIALSVFIILNSTAYPTISGGDTGELAVVACKLSIAHPPGYPLYTMLTYLFTMLPTVLGTAAYRITLFNILCSSINSALLFLLIHKLNHGYNIIACVLGSIIYTFSYTVWLYTIQVEVFPLNNILCTALLYIALIYYEYEAQLVQYNDTVVQSKKQDTTTQSVDINKVHTKLLHTAYLGAFFCGLAATNQHTTVFYIVPIILFVTVNLIQHNLLTIHSTVYLTLSLLLGFSPYLYLPIRSTYKPIDAWGNQATLQGFLTHFLRQEYGTFQLAASDIGAETTLNDKLYVYIDNARTELLTVILLLPIIGIISSLIYNNRAYKIVTVLYIVCYTVYIVVFHYLANLDHRPLFLGVQARFWQQPNLILCIYCTTGLITVVNTLTYIVLYVLNILKYIHTQSTVTYTYSISHKLCSGIALALCLYQLLRNYKYLDHSQTDYIYLYGYNQLQTFPHDSLVLLNGDLNNNALKYAQQCEGYRPDVQLIGLQQMSWEWYVDMHKDNYPTVKFPGNRYHPYKPDGFSIRQFLEANTQHSNRTYLCGPFKDGDNSLVLQTQPHIITLYEELPYGLCRRLIHKDIGLPTGKKLLSELRSGLDGITYTELPKFNGKLITNDMWEYIVYSDMFDRLLHITSYISFYANKNSADTTKLLTLAKSLYDRVLDREDEFIELHKMTDEIYRSAGVIYGMYSKIVQDKPTQYNNATDMMFTMWSKYLILKPSDNDIRGIVKSRVNPYTGQKH